MNCTALVLGGSGPSIAGRRTRRLREVEELLGDRAGGLEPLAGRRFDAVIDTSGMTPRVVRASAELLADAEHYAFVSTGNVYADNWSLDGDPIDPKP